MHRDEKSTHRFQLRESESEFSVRTTPLWEEPKASYLVNKAIMNKDLQMQNTLSNLTKFKYDFMKYIINY